MDISTHQGNWITITTKMGKFNIWVNDDGSLQIDAPPSWFSMSTIQEEYRKIHVEAKTGGASWSSKKPKITAWSLVISADPEKEEEE